MFLLKKVFQLRDKANPELEKPFLEHLEDLRVMITRSILALTISMIVCFSFQEDLMRILRMPVDKVLQIHEGKALPDDIKVDEWGKAKEIEHASLGLTEAQRGAYLASFDAATQSRIDLVRLLRAAKALPDDHQRSLFLSSATHPTQAARVQNLLTLGTSPEIDQRGKLQMMSALSPTEPFMLSMKLAFFAGIVLAFPFLMTFILQFILPGLHANERRVLWPALSIGFGLFLIGVSFAYFLVLPRALTFFYEWSGSLGISNDWRIGEYITFATQFTLLFGLSFELPVIVMVLVKLGLITHDTMRRTRSYAILAIVVAAAVITPTPDAFTMSLMAGPMIVLYEMCIWLSWFDERKRRRAEEAEEKERMERLLTGAGADETEAGEQEDRGDRFEQLAEDLTPPPSGHEHEPEPEHDPAPPPAPAPAPAAEDPAPPSADTPDPHAAEERDAPAVETAPEKEGPPAPDEPTTLPGEEDRRLSDPGEPGKQP